MKQEIQILEDYQENYQSGWIKLYRSIKNHWIWEDPIKLKWWFDILITVNHFGKKVNLGLEIYDCLPGQSIRSLNTWAKDWNVSKDTVRNFFTLLKKDNMIILENLKKTTRLTVCNYAIYQTCLHDKQTTALRLANDWQTQGDPNKNDKNIKNDNKIEFDIFWNIYNKKVGAKKKCIKKWDKLPIETQQRIIESLPNFIKQFSDKQFQPFPETYLNQERWNDEIIDKKTTEQKYIEHYKLNQSDEKAPDYAYMLKEKKDILYTFKEIISIDEFKRIRYNGGFKNMISTFINYGKSKDEFLTNIGIHFRKFEQ